MVHSKQTGKTPENLFKINNKVIGVIVLNSEQFCC